VIEVRDVTKRFGERVALDRVSFDVRPGDVVGFLGPNGAGKTTAMRIITGYMPPTDGSVRIKGLSVFDHPYEVKRVVGYLPEHPPLYTDMTVREYLSFAGQLRGLRGRGLRTGMERVVELCGIGHVIMRLVGNLSKGYRQRVGLAQALIHDPQVLVLDEPTVGLDPRQIVEIRSLIRELGREKTIILSTHILQEVVTVCKSVIIINNGRILLSDSLESLSSRFSDETKVRVRVKRPDLFDRERLLGQEGVLEVQELPDGGFEIRVGQGADMAKVSEEIMGMGVGLVAFSPEGPSLEDIFIRVVTEDVAH